MHTVAYARVSTDQQSIAAQRADIERWAAKERVVIDEWYIDEGTSGASVSRPSWDRLIAALAAGRVSTLVVWALDRLFRWEPTEQLHFMLQLHRTGVRVVSLMEPNAGLSNLADSIVSIVGMHTRHDERLKIKARVTSGVRNALTVGVRDKTTKAPTGDTRWGGQRVSHGTPGGPKLTAAQREEIGRAVAAGAKKLPLGRKYGVSRATISAVATRWAAEQGTSGRSACA